MIVKLNNDYFVVDNKGYKKVVKTSTKSKVTDWVKVTEWVESNGAFINGSEYLILEKEEVAAIVKELYPLFISRDNPLCDQVLSQMIYFLKEK